MSSHSPGSLKATFRKRSLLSNEDERMRNAKISRLEGLKEVHPVQRFSFQKKLLDLRPGTRAIPFSQTTRKREHRWMFRMAKRKHGITEIDLSRRELCHEEIMKICSEAERNSDQGVRKLLLRDINLINFMGKNTLRGVLDVCPRLKIINVTGCSETVQQNLVGVGVWVKTLVESSKDLLPEAAELVEKHELSYLQNKGVNIVTGEVKIAVPIALPWNAVSSKYNDQLAQVARMQYIKTISSIHYHFRHIGEGSFGCVFVGINKVDGREVAVKRIERQRLPTSKAKREIESLIKLKDCKQVVQYISLHVDNHFLYIVLELMEGSLENLLRDNELSPRDAMKLCGDLVKGLEFLHTHERPILHRDLKPSNILYATKPELCLKIADFGLSKFVDPDHRGVQSTVQHTNAGTRCWVAPELLTSTTMPPHSVASDVFACGLLLHYIIATKHAFLLPEDESKGGMEQQNAIEYNIMMDDKYIDDSRPEFRDLLSRVLEVIAAKRPSTTEILQHPFFWGEKKKLEFLFTVGNDPGWPSRREKAKSQVGVDMKETLDPLVKQWDRKVPSTLFDKSQRPYNSREKSSAVHLVRFIRNCYSHLQEDLYKARILDIFPSLLIKVFNIVEKHGWSEHYGIKRVLDHSDHNDLMFTNIHARVRTFDTSQSYTSKLSE